MPSILLVQHLKHDAVLSPAGAGREVFGSASAFLGGIDLYFHGGSD